MCTSIYQIALDGSHVLGRTMDWHALGAAPVFVPRNHVWRSVFDDHQYHNRYAMIGSGGAHDDEIDISDGVNEYGLSVQKLTFTNGALFDQIADPNRTSLAPFELPFYLLGNFKSVAEIEAHLPELQMMSGENAVHQYGYPELHFVATDPTGRIVAIETSHQPLKMIENPLGILTNAFDFKRQIRQLDNYMTLTEAFKAGQVPLNTPRVSTGSFSGKKVPLGSYTPGSRFIRAAYYKERVDQPANEDEAVVSVWHLLNSVSVPKSTDYQHTYTVYRSAVSLETRTYYYEPYNRLGLLKLQLTDEMLDWTEPHFYGTGDQLHTETLA
ncbi:linear amide C-N hydrolase [Secundilactobacillus similis]|uniref:Penicillin V acylase related amidase n=1 Tax=Secundilactobacillus similis DSM 23365 = JCM 2765 TaxID=1423804 RepID=A0A0R2FJE7_9LACO|nr:linear amide C-N hydrolase [Secundilactobacillus similis]KRN25191.1 penicillin V acylase related amidase [Secundilactobacillus similis DSM 23365 = JCM 2765]